jgi:hypothetical protein
VDKWYYVYFSSNYICIKFVIWMDDKIIKEVGEALALLVIGGFTVYKQIKEWVKKRGSAKVIVSQIAKNYKIHEKLVELRVDMDASRVDVTQFHNGDFYTNNNSILKMSMSYEVLDDSTSSVMQLCQNILVSKFPEMFKELATNEIYFVKNVDNLGNKELKSELKIRGTKSLYTIKITNANGQMMGYISVAYTHEAVEQIDLNLLTEYAGVLSLMLR